MSYRNQVFPICLIALLPSSRSQAIVFTPARDIHDDAKVINHVQEDPRVGGWRRETEWFRRRLMRWQVRDYHTLFGEPIEAHKVDDALMVGETRMLGLSIHSLDPNVNKSHFDGYPVADVGRLVVYFGDDGESPMHVLFYLKTDNDFPKLDDEAKLEKRLAWERPRFARLQKEVDRCWREAIVWEIDTEKEKAASQGLDSGDYGVKFHAMLRWGQQKGYTLEYEPAGNGEPASWRWFHEGVCLVEATAEATPMRGGLDEELLPKDFVFYRPDGTCLRADTTSPWQTSIFWYWPSGKRARWERGNLHDGAWRALEWSWYDTHGEIVRSEADSNGDGVPDVHGTSELFNHPPDLPLTVDRSWAVHPELVPENLRVPGQAERRVSLRRIPE